MKHIAINEIKVKKLFGYLNYVIKNEDLNKIQQLIILYGDNGSGKTTILKLLFFLLSSKEQAGHKSEIARLKFQEFQVILNNGISVGAIRTSRRQIGAYKYYIKKNDIIIHQVDMVPDPGPEFTILMTKSTQKEIEEFQNILAYLRNLDLRLFYLTDSRKALDVGITNFSEPESDFHYTEFEGAFIESNIQREYARKRKSQSEDINTTIRLLENFIKSKTIEASVIGEQKTTDIYLSIVKGVTTDLLQDTDLSSKVDDLRDILNEVIQRSVVFSNLGFISDSEFKKILPAFRAKSSQKLGLIYKILEPYIKGLQAKLDALTVIQQQVSSFIDGLNSYFKNKQIMFSIKEGFKILQDYSGEELEFNKLSSGEKQLVQVFANVILASSKATIFIVDEPEISLNIKWQRNLLKTLLDFNSTGSMQFIMATHSIELITNYNDFVIRLNSKN